MLCNLICFTFFRFTNINELTNRDKFMSDKSKLKKKFRDKLMVQ